MQEIRLLSDTIYNGGKIIFRYEEVNSFKSLDDYLPFFNLGENVTFEVASEKQSRFDKDKLYTRYEQFYKGILVDGGGVTAGYIKTHGGTTTTDGGPCDRLQMLAPYFFSDINISVVPTISEKQIRELLGVSSMKADLIITTNIRNDFEYLLTWKVNHGRKVSWIDANSSEILKSIDAIMHKNAPTEDYGIQDMLDFTVGGITSLESGDLDENPNVDRFVRTYDFAGKNIYETKITDFKMGLIPTSAINEDWSNGNAPNNVFQAHFIASAVSNFYAEELDINFNTLHVGANCTELNAGALPTSSLTEGWIVVGESNSSTLAEVDIIGHELAHVYLNGFLNYSEAGNASLQEGLADMYGTYIESLFQGNLDWQGGDEVPIDGRDLENPSFTCYTDVEDFTFEESHLRSTPLGHWFYLITEGDSGIPSLGIERAITIVDESLTLLGSNSDYQELLDATITVVSEEFGICSKEYYSVTEAWASICLGDELDIRCPGSLRGNYSVCEESDYLNVWVNGASFPDYKWLLKGREALNYENCCFPQSGNHVYGGNSLTIIDFPHHPFYPQYLRIEATPFGYFPNIKLTFKVKIEDCDGDDPTCEEYYNNSSHTTNESSTLNNEAKLFLSNLEKLKGSKVSIIDLLGRPIYNGEFDDFHFNSEQFIGNFVFVVLQRTGEVIKFETHFLNNK